MSDTWEIRERLVAADSIHSDEIFRVEKFLTKESGGMFEFRHANIEEVTYNYEDKYGEFSIVTTIRVDWRLKKGHKLRRISLYRAIRALEFMHPLVDSQAVQALKWLASNVRSGINILECKNEDYIFLTGDRVRWSAFNEIAGSGEFI